MPPQFTLVDYTVEDRPMLLPNGARLPDAEQVRVGAKFKQWTDERGMRSWFLQARAYLDDAAKKAECDAPYVGSEEQGRKQREFVLRVANAIAQAYNHGNLVAMNDPKVRYAYFRHISGPPAGETLDAILQNWFKPNQNFGGGFLDSRDPFGRWCVPNRPLPIFGRTRGAKDPGGSIPMNAWNAYQKFVTVAPCDMVQFRVATGIALRPDPVGGVTEGARTEYQPSTRNEPFLAVNLTTSFGALPDGRWFLDTAGRPLPFDWRMTYMESCFGRVGDSIGTVCAPLRMYLDFFDEIVEAALSRTPAQIVQDTISFVTWLNYSTMLRGFGGSPARFMSAVASNDAEVMRAIDAPDPTITRISAGVSAIGGSTAALLTAVNPIAGGVTALVTGMINGVLRIVDLVTPGEVRGKGVDELGRYKPTLERSALSGNLGDEFGGRPQITGLADAPMGRLTESELLQRFLREVNKIQARRLMLNGPPTLDGYDWGAFKDPPKKPDTGSDLGWFLAAAATVAGALAWKNRRKRSS